MESGAWALLTEKGSNVDGLLVGLDPEPGQGERACSLGPLTVSARAIFRCGRP
jgi:hypothetical protein